MRRVLSSISFILLIAFCAICGHYDLPQGVRSAELKVRVQAPSEKASSCEMRWAAADSANYMYATVQSDGLSGVDDATGTALTFTHGECRNGIRKKLNNKVFTSRSGNDSISYSLHFRVRGGEILLQAGADRLNVVQKINADIGDIQRITVVPGGSARVKYSRWRCDSIPAPRFSDPDSILAHLSASKDPYEKIWTYFDRNTDPLLSRLGGKYRLATVASPDRPGDYCIIYLGGADEDDSDWPAGRVKGVLRATSIPGTYDLEWLQPDGTPVTEDTGAVFEGHFLILQFPRWKATVRFRPANS